MNWYTVSNIDEIDSPALLVYEERMKSNLAALQKQIPDNNRLRPHVKTNKTAEVCQLMQEAGINKFKCATIAEAEMLGMIKAKDVLLAYPVAGPKLKRFVQLVKTFPATKYSCLVVDQLSAKEIDNIASSEKIIVEVFIDLNVGMNRTGIATSNAWSLVETMHHLKNVIIAGLHAYDGHITDPDPAIRKQREQQAFEPVFKLKTKLEDMLGKQIPLVSGGSTTYAIHAAEGNVECSPGTFIFWDWGYGLLLPEAPFVPAAVLLTRIISVINKHIICVDLGHKSVAAENPQPRVQFLNLPGAKMISQSEEHLVVEVADTSALKVGDVLYAVPFHICPTVALYDKLHLVNHAKVNKEWKVIARDRYINV